MIPSEKKTSFKRRTLQFGPGQLKAGEDLFGSPSPKRTRGRRDSG